MTFSLVINLPFVIAIVGGVLAIIDGITRVRGRSAILGILQIVAAGLFVLSLFVAGIPLGSTVLALATVVLLILGLAFRGSSRGSSWLGIVALFLLIAWLVLVPRAIVIPGVNA
jgi:hypothetical protein